MHHIPDDSTLLSDQSSTPPQAEEAASVVLTQVSLVPSEAEEDDIRTIALVEEVKEQMIVDIARSGNYLSRIESSGTRDGGMILIIGEIARQVIANKDLVVEMCKSVVAVLALLARQKHVKKIEIELNGDRMSVDEPDTVTVQRLLDIYEAAHPGKVANSSSPSTIHVTATLSQQQ